jgi:hypothetical protein
VRDLGDAGILQGTRPDPHAGEPGPQQQGLISHLVSQDGGTLGGTRPHGDGRKAVWVHIPPLAPGLSCERCNSPVGPIQQPAALPSMLGAARRSRPASGGLSLRWTRNGPDRRARVKVVKIGILPEESTPTLLAGDQSLDNSPERNHHDERGDDEYLVEQRGQLPFP